MLSDLLLDVLPVRMPAQVDRPELTIQQGAGTVVPLEQERWAAPVDAEFRTALSAGLVYRLGAFDLAGLPRPEGRPLLRVNVEVRRFESVPGKYALIEVDWSLTVSDGRHLPPLLCHSLLREPAEADYVSLVRAHQRAIGRLADLITMVGRAAISPEPRGCPSESAKSSDNYRAKPFT